MPTYLQVTWLGFLLSSELYQVQLKEGRNLWIVKRFFEMENMIKQLFNLRSYFKTIRLLKPLF